MSEEVAVTANPLEQALANIIDSTVNTAVPAINKSISFLQGEIPEVISQLLIWKGVESFLYFCIAMLLLSIIPAWWVIGAYKFDLSEDGGQMAYFIPGAIGTLFFTIIGSCALSIKWLQIWIAPKIYLIEYAADLIK